MIKVKEILAKYPSEYKKSACIPLLDLAQRQHHGWLPLAAMNKVAKIIGVPAMEVYETATFYSMFNREPIGKHLVQMCTTTPCALCGSGPVLEALKEYMGVEVGETSSDGVFTLLEVECLGACVNAPMMQIGDDYYEDLTPETAVDVVRKLKNGEKPKVGPQTEARRVAEPVGGLTTLKEKPYGPSAPLLDRLEKERAEKAKETKEAKA